MNTLKTVAIATMVLGSFGVASAATDAGFAVPVCADTMRDNFVDLRARDLASKMFASAGVNIAWHGLKGCPKGAVRIHYSYETRPALLPGALAYALPFEGETIVVFYDRMKACGDVLGASTRAALLAHVLTHEITHILQGVAVHSQTGIMQPEFTQQDRANMARKPMTFTDADVELLHLGISVRLTRQIAAR
ncbi:MAG: hypothetical protein ABI824_15950 [Acidobacteriota bacterium]